MKAGHLSSRQFAVLDLGTNTFHLLIASTDGKGAWKSIYRTRKTVKLGEGGFGKNLIAEAPFLRGVNAIKDFKKKLISAGVTEVYACATSAIRSSKNGVNFVRRIRQETGIRIQVIDGEREAELIAAGVMQTLPQSDRPILIMDIGGGSTEFIIVRSGEIIWKRSFDIGAARLLEKFKPTDPIQSSQVLSIRRYLVRQLEPLERALKRHPVKLLVSASGSAESYAKMIGYRHRGINPIASRKTYSFDLMEYGELHKDLLSSTTALRKTMPGLVQMRIDMIVPASISTYLVLKRFRIPQMMLSTFALKEGVAGVVAAGGRI